MSSQQSTAESQLIKAIAHPLRHRILVALNERVASPSELADQLDEPLGNVSYHTKVLLESGAIELVRTRQVRGATQHYYKGSVRAWLDDEHWSRLPISLRRALLDLTLQKAWEHVVEAAESGGLDDPRTHITCTSADLDRRGFDEAADLLAETLERYLTIQAEAAGRLNALATDERETERTELFVMHYHRPRRASHG